MSVTGPGCAHCDRGRVTTPDGDRRPCDRCGGWSQFARLHNEAITEMRQPFADALATAYQPVVDEIAARHGMPAPRVRFGSAPSPETDWRPLPSCAEVLAHNARTGGDCFGAWMCLTEPDDEGCAARVEMLAVASGDYDHEERVVDSVGVDMAADGYPNARYRPITRRGEALPWPEVPR